MCPHRPHPDKGLRVPEHRTKHRQDRSGSGNTWLMCCRRLGDGRSRNGTHNPCVRTDIARTEADAFPKSGGNPGLAASITSPRANSDAPKVRIAVATGQRPSRAAQTQSISRPRNSERVRERAMPADDDRPSPHQGLNLPVPLFGTPSTKRSEVVPRTPAPLSPHFPEG